MIENSNSDHTHTHTHNFGSGNFSGVNFGLILSRSLWKSN